MESQSRINLELTALGGNQSGEFTTNLKNSIRVFTHPYRLKLSSLRLRQNLIIDTLPIKYDLFLRAKDTNQALRIGSYESEITLTENHYKNFRALSRLMKRMVLHDVHDSTEPHYHQIPEFIYEDHCVTMRFIIYPEFYSNEEQVYVQFTNETVAEMLGVSLFVLNDKLKDLQAREFVFDKTKLARIPDLYIHCSIASSIGYKNNPHDLIRVVRVPQDVTLVHLDFDDDLWTPGKMTGEIKKITIKLKDSKGRMWPKFANDCSVVLTLEGNLYKTSSPVEEETQPE